MQDLHLFGIHLFYYLLVLAFVLPRVPVVGKFFNIINTLIHELGHALLSLILQGQVINIQIFNDTSGVTLTKTSSTFVAIMVSLAGYPFSALAGYACAHLLSVGYEMWIVAGLSIIFLFMLILWIRNIYGIIWTLVFVGVNALLIYYWKNAVYIQIAAWFYTLMILIESVWSALVLVALSFRNSDQAGDATNLRNFTRIPAVVWALLFAAFAVWMGWHSLLKLGVI